MSFDKSNEICLLNDAFPPIIDGVANAVVNYAKILTKNDVKVSVITPQNADADDSKFDYDVIRYASIDMRQSLGYTAGIPATFNIFPQVKEHKIGLLHSHCPISSTMIARSLRSSLNVPVVLTYHTKFDIDIANVTDSKLLQNGALNALVENVNACDEVWTVSKGAGENLKKIGYNGDYIVMENGVDIPRQNLSDETIIKHTSEVDVPKDVPLYLFVGRMMWYKGIKIILDALAALKSQDIDFRMVFIGKGGDFEEIKDYSEKANLGDKVFFLGPIYDREQLSAWYSRADLFLFPSTFDTNGLVVREAAACSLGCVLVNGSCAAEGTTNRDNCLIIDENAASLAACLATAGRDKSRLKEIGQAASNSLYMSWDQAVEKAMDRYQIVIDNFKSGKYPKHNSLQDELFNLEAGIDEVLSFKNKITQEAKSFLDWKF